MSYTNLKSLNVIGSGREDNGLYYLDLVPEVKKVVIYNNTIAKLYPCTISISDL